MIWHFSSGLFSIYFYQVDISYTSFSKKCIKYTCQITSRSNISMTWYSQCYCFFIYTIFVSGNIRTPETDVHKEDKAHPPVIVFDMKQRKKNTPASLKWMLLTVSDKNQGINTDKDFLNDYILCKSTESQNHKSPSIFTEKKDFVKKLIHNNGFSRRRSSSSAGRIPKAGKDDWKEVECVPSSNYFSTECGPICKYI